MRLHIMYDDDRSCLTGMITRPRGQQTRKPPYTVVKKRFPTPFAFYSIPIIAMKNFAREFPHLTFEALVKYLCKSVFYQLRNITKRIRCSINEIYQYYYFIFLCGYTGGTQAN